MIKILFIGDIFGEPGRLAVKTFVPRLREEHNIDLVIANCENSAQGRGITTKQTKELLSSSIDLMTSGNHIWHCNEIYPYLNQNDCKILRPANLPQESPGRGASVVEARGGIKVAVFNLMGKVFMNPQPDCPFSAFDRLIQKYEDEADVIVIDFHAETTAEKRAFGWYVDGLAQACVGTHTHVPTADEEILPKGCAYITDVGMTGPHNSVIGMKKETALTRFRTTLPAKFEVGAGDVRLNGAIVEIDVREKKGVSIKRICERIL